MSGSPRYSIIGDRIIYSTVVSPFHCNFWPRTGVLDDDKTQLGVSHMTLAHLLLIVGSEWQHLSKAFRFFLHFFLSILHFVCSLKCQNRTWDSHWQCAHLAIGEKPMESRKKVFKINLVVCRRNIKLLSIFENLLVCIFFIHLK